MKKFKFRLQRVLQYRQAVKSELQRELMLANSKLLAEETKLEELKAAQLANKLSHDASANIEEFMMRGLYAERLKIEINAQHQSIATAKVKVEEAREKYVEAAKEARALETLKDKKAKAYAEYVEQEDSKFLDEIVTQRVSRIKQKQDAI